MQRKIQAVLAGLLVLASLTVSGPLGAAQPETALAADTSVVNCTEASFDAALAAVQASGGGQLSLACSTTIPFTEQKTITSDVTIVGNGVFTLGSASVFTILDGGGTTRLFQVNAGARLKLVNLALMNGAAINGAAIQSSGTLEIVNSHLSQNDAVGDGGAIQTTGGSLEIVHSDFFSNSAGDDGGALHIYGTARITDGHFHFNQSDFSGGAIFNDSEIGLGSTLEITRSEFTSNSASGFGGAIDNNTFSTLTIQASSFDENFSARDGGAISNGGTATVTASTFNANHIPTAGPVFNTGGAISNGGALNITNSTFVGNDGKMGGAIYNASVGQTIIKASTFSANNASISGATLRDDAAGTNGIEIGASILAGKPSTGHCFGVIRMNGYTLRDDGTCGMSGTGDILSDDIMLSALGDNGGPTKTALPLEGSPAREAIPQADCLTYSSSTDQRGVTRPNDNCEIGAVELGEIILEPLQIIDVVNHSPVLPGQQVLIVVVPIGPASHTLTYEFDCASDGTFEISQQDYGAAFCTFSEPGTYFVTVRVRVPPNMSASVQTVVEVQAATPQIASLTVAPSPSSEGTTVELEAAYNNVDPSVSHTCAINWGDGGEVETGTVEEQDGTGNCQGNHIYVDDGPYIVTVEICNGDVCDTDTVDHTVLIVEPVVNTPQITPSPSNEGEGVTASAGFSDPLGGTTGPDTHSCTVDYGDGSGVQDGTVAGDVCTGPEHTYADNGDYAVTVSVTDTGGDVGSNTTSHSVANVAPTVTLGDDVEITTGDTFTGTGSFSDPGANDSHSAIVNYGDGTGAQPLTLNADGSFDLSHTYQTADSYLLSVCVTDDDSVAGGCDTLVVSVVNPPITTADTGGPYSGTEGSPVSLVGMASDPEDDPLTTTWSYAFNDSDPGASCTFADASQLETTITCTDDGTVTVTLTADDGTNPPASDSTTVAIANARPEISHSGNVVINAGETFTGSGQITDPGTNDTLSATVNYSDGTGSQPLSLNPDGSFSLSHLYPADWGNYYILICAGDDEGDRSCDNALKVEVQVPANQPPTVEAGDPYNGEEGSPISLQGSVSDADNDTLTTTWSYTIASAADGTTCAFGDASAIDTTFTCTNDGDFTVTLMADDGTNPTVTDTAAVTISNVAPAVGIGDDIELNEGGTATTTGSFTDRGTEDIHSATVDYGDGSGEQPLTLNADGTFSLSHTYPVQGEYQVRVCITDDDQGQGCDGLEVRVHNVAPAVSLGDDLEIDEGGTYSGNGSFSDPGGPPTGTDTHTATVDYGDGAGPQPLPFDADGSFNLSHSYPDDGQYMVEVCVTDDDWGQGCDALLVTVLNVAPSVSLGDDVTINQVDTFTTSGSFSDPGPNDTHTATVDYGDGAGAQPLTLNPGGGFTLSHMYGSAGQFTVEVCVADDDQGVGCDQLVVATNNGSPTVDAGGPYSGTEGGSITLDGAASDPENDALTTAWSYVIDSADDGTTCAFADASQPETTFSCTDDGTFTLTLTADDGSNPAVASTATVTIANSAPAVSPGDDATLDEGGSFSGSGSFSDPGANDTHTATVDYGDGSGVQSLSLDLDGNFDLSHAYLDDGQYTVEVCLADDDGETGCDELLVTVLNVAPTITEISLQVSDGQAMVTVIASDPAGENDPLSYAFDCQNDDGYEIGPQPDNSAACDFGHQEGSFWINVQVDDGDGGITTGSVDVVVPSTMCSSTHTGLLRYTDDCQHHETAISIPDPDGPVTLCARDHNGLLRAPLNGACADHEEEYVLPEDGPLNVCVNTVTLTLRVVDNLGSCTSNEFGRVIAATETEEPPPARRR